MKHIDKLAKNIRADFSTLEERIDSFSGVRYFIYRGDDLRILFAEEGFSNEYASGRICIERKDCFDKWSKSPICLPIPETDEQMAFLWDQIFWLLTEEGYVASNNYEMDKWIKDYPNQLKEPEPQTTLARSVF